MMELSQAILLTALALVPGYLFSTAVYPRKILGAERFFLSFFFSFTIVPAALLAENLFFSVKLTFLVISWNLAVFVVLSMAAAFYRIRKTGQTLKQAKP